MFVACCFAKGCPLVMIHSILWLKCTCYVLTDGLAGGCWAVNRSMESALSGIELSARKVHGHILTQTDQTDADMLTHTRSHTS